MRDGLLNEALAGCGMSFLTKPLFFGLAHAWTTITNWVGNQRRPHSALGYLTPAAYAANLTATCDRLRNPDQLRRSYVAPTAPHGVKSAEALITAGRKFGGRSTCLALPSRATTSKSRKSPLVRVCCPHSARERSLPGALPALSRRVPLTGRGCKHRSGPAPNGSCRTSRNGPKGCRQP